MNRKLYLFGGIVSVFLIFIIWLFAYLFIAGRHTDETIDHRARVAGFLACLFGIAIVVKFAWEVWRTQIEEQSRDQGDRDELKCEVKWDSHPFPEGRLTVSLYNGNNLAVSVRHVSLHCARMEKPEIVVELKAFCRVDPPEAGVAGLVTSRWKSSFVIEPHHPVSVYLQPSEVIALLPMIAAEPDECTFIEIATEGGFLEVITGEQIKPIVQIVLSKLAKKT
jgi:hypothetical protein